MNTSHGRIQSAIMKVICGLTLSALAACASPSVASNSSSARAGDAGTAANASPTDPFAPPAFEGPLPANRNYVEAGLQLVVPKDSDIPKIGYSQALSTCISGDAICERTIPPSVYLTRATVTSTGQETETGSLQQTIVGRLVYLIEYDNVPCVPAGRAPGVQSSGSPQRCTKMTLVDADTGSVLWSVRGSLK